jgi:putative membrane protein
VTVSEDDRRWPGRVYREGTEPDPRFTFANERTFLAWIRTSLALVAAGVALEAFVGGLVDSVRKSLAAVLVALGVVTSAAAYGRWMAGERALRQKRPLPAPLLAPLLGYDVAITGVLVFAFAALSR